MILTLSKVGEKFMQKKYLVFLLAALVIISCASTGGFSDITGKDWKLLEVYVDVTFKREILFNRSELSREGAGKFFTLKFNEEMVSGTGAPNLYSAPFTLGEDNAITIMPMRSTLMASTFQPEKLQEHVFYFYMSNVYEWSVENKKLVLKSKTQDGSEVRMIFGR